MTRAAGRRQDAWDVEGPIRPAIYAVDLALFGRTELGVRLSNLILWTTGLLGMLRLARQLDSSLDGEASIIRSIAN
jgi:hypothetical protein